MTPVSVTGKKKESSSTSEPDSSYDDDVVEDLPSTTESKIPIRPVSFMRNQRVKKNTFRENVSSQMSMQSI